MQHEATVRGFFLAPGLISLSKEKMLNQRTAFIMLAARRCGAGIC
jgi:hypothetical protein